jgi:hypothetical protein
MVAVRLLCLLLVPNLAVAAKPMMYAPFQKGLETPGPSVTRADGRFDAETGKPLAIYAPAFRSNAADPVAQALDYLGRTPGGLRLPAAADHGLEVDAVREVGPLTVVRLRQTYRSLPVYGTELVVSLADGAVVYAQFAVKDAAGDGSAGPVIDDAAALEHARSYLRAKEMRDLRVDRVWWVGDATRLAWRIVGQPDSLDGAHWELLVDALDGRILRAENLDSHANGTGLVFDPDPLSSAQAAYGTTGYVDGNDANTPQLQAQTFNRPLRDITLNGGVYSLVGPYAACVDWDAPTGTCATNTTGIFNFTRDDDNFESVNVYYHLDTYMRYINQTLGIALTPRQYAGGVQYDPRGFSGADNSSFSSATGRLRFGEGGVDDAEDADVVIHELGHGIHDWITNGGLSQVQGLSEGVGDYVAASYSRSFNHWPTNAAAYSWMFDWDGHNPFWGGRITNYHLSVTYQTLPSGLHTPGQYWASCNLLNYNTIGREAADRAFLLGLAMTGGSTNQQDAAQAVLNAAATAGYTPAQLSTMHANFTAGTSDPNNRRCTYVLTLPQGGILFANGFE